MNIPHRVLYICGGLQFAIRETQFNISVALRQTVCMKKAYHRGANEVKIPAIISVQFKTSSYRNYQTIDLL